MFLVVVLHVLDKKSGVGGAKMAISTKDYPLLGTATGVVALFLSVYFFSKECFLWHSLIARALLRCLSPP